MNVIITGDSGIDDFTHMRRAAEAADFEITEVLTTGREGAADLGERYAALNHINCNQVEPDWDLDAPEDYEGSDLTYQLEQRNEAMVAAADAVLVIGDSSDATPVFLVKEAVNQGVPIESYHVRTERSASTPNMVPPAERDGEVPDTETPVGNLAAGQPVQTRGF